jgi:hypothetical protein
MENIYLLKCEFYNVMDTSFSIVSLQGCKYLLDLSQKYKSSLWFTTAISFYFCTLIHDIYISYYLNVCMYLDII